MPVQDGKIFVREGEFYWFDTHLQCIFNTCAVVYHVVFVMCHMSFAGVYTKTSFRTTIILSPFVLWLCLMLPLHCR